MPKKTNKRLILVSEQEAEIIKTFVGKKLKWLARQADDERYLLGPSSNAFGDVAEVAEALVERLKETFAEPFDEKSTYRWLYKSCDTKRIHISEGCHNVMDAVELFGTDLINPILETKNETWS